jgi:hypothetical protein
MFHRFGTIIAASVACLAGCAQEEGGVEIGRAFVRPTTVAVAPVLNFSGEFDLDPLKAADLLASELSYVQGLTVLPVNRVVAYLANQGRRQVESPAHALEVAEGVGADAIIVAGITEYDAYTPIVGVVLQIYSPSAHEAPSFDPVMASRLSQPFDVTRLADPLLPTSQVQAVYDASHDRIRKAVRQFAGPRFSSEDPLGWRRYLKVQTLYLRFCWHTAVNGLMNQERSRRMLLANGTARETPA